MSSPVYQSLLSELRTEVVSQRVPPGALLDTEVGLAQRSGISRNSVRAVIDQLIGEGLVERRRGKGVYVRSQPVALRPIELIVPNLSDIWEGVAVGAQMYGLEHCLKLQIYNANSQLEADRAALRALPGLGVQGALIGSLLQPELHDELRALHRAGFPFVMLDERLRDLPVPSVMFDGWQAGHLAGQKLLALGHRRIGFVGYTTGEFIRQRLDGLRDAVNDAGLPFDRTAVIELSVGALAGESAADWHAPLRDLLRRPDRPTALVLHREGLAPEVYALAADLGLRIPEDLSMVALGAGAVARLVVPQLSMVILSGAAMGHTGLELLLARLAQSKTAMDHHLLPGAWRDGQSIAPRTAEKPMVAVPAH